MRRGGSRAIVGTLALTLLGAGGVAPPMAPRATATPAVVERAPADVLRGYFSALAALRRPKALSFDYTVSQLGLHDMEQTHHIYRSGYHERDEMMIVDGHTLTAPSVRILRSSTYRYDVTTVAPRASQYVFAFGSRTRGQGAGTYSFRTKARSARAFQVVEIEIDGHTLLPAVVHFRVAGGRARGNGTLRYGRSDTRWVVREARVTAKLANGATAHERIVWSNYRFYDALPHETFEAPKVAVPKKPLPKPGANRLPTATPTPTPTPPGAR